MTETTHNPRCLKMQEDLKNFQEKHPTYCRKCGGSGVTHYSGSRWEPPSDDPCQCVETGHCPLCMEKTDFDEATDVSTCTVCGWTDKTYFETGHITWETAPDVDCWCDFQDFEPAEDSHLESLYESRTETDFYVEGE